MEPSELFAEFGKNRQAVSQLRSQLNELSEKLKPLFLRKREIREGISSRLHKVKALREERDALTAQVRQHKQEREHAESELKVKMGTVKELQQIPVQEQRMSPGRIRQEIEKIEYKIETEVMSFDKEQKLMKRIKELQKKLEEALKANDAYHKMRTARDEAREVRKKGEEEHHLVQQQAAESQKKHENLILLLKEVDGLRVQDKETEEEIQRVKVDFNKVKSELEQALLKLNESGKKVDELKHEASEKKKRQVEEELEQKMKSVEEKLKRGEKLTTQDLLAWQAKGE